PPAQIAAQRQRDRELESPPHLIAAAGRALERRRVRIRRVQRERVRSVRDREKEPRAPRRTLTGASIRERRDIGAERRPAPEAPDRAAAQRDAWRAGRERARQATDRADQRERADVARADELTIPAPDRGVVTALQGQPHRERVAEQRLPPREELPFVRTDLRRDVGVRRIDESGQETPRE